MTEIYVNDPPGDFEFEETYDHDLYGTPLKRRDAKRDYLERIVGRYEDLVPDRDHLLEFHVHRYEEEDVDP